MNYLPLFVIVTFPTNIDKVQHSSHFLFSLHTLNSLCTHMAVSAAKLPNAFLALGFVNGDRMLRLWVRDLHTYFDYGKFALVP